MKVLVVGNGGREHALAWKIKQSPHVEQIYCAPGNPGTEELGQNIALKADDTAGLIRFAKEHRIDLTVAGPEAPLVAGIVDAFEKENLRIFGPTAHAAQLEGSKVFAKKLMQKYNIPTAGFFEFRDMEKARLHLEKHSTYPVVLKADGLAAGKGVLICENREQALSGLKLIMADKAFGKAGDALVVEDFLSGEEVSVFAICDGMDYLLLPASQDHKKVGEGDRGKNTGGMGAYAPAPLVTTHMLNEIEKTIIKPTLGAMQKEGHPYKGLLYFGLMITDGKPYILEYNCRFGDPETEAVLPLLVTDLVPLLEASIDGTLSRHSISLNPGAAMDVVLASGGYPGAYEKNFEISGLEQVSTEVLIFHAGTARKDGKLVTSGGRVLNVVGLGRDLKEAKEAAYEAIKKIRFKNMYYRRDIGFRALKD